ncbi:putative zinc finger protein [Edaphobacter aggregans]|uniref:Putative zinc finger protein n=1 Tax=Edaphobacter aggregans TaxID=570835 RepID=A0A3R9QA74_9BACT|nr:zf-HC2 domain-containing protein [Edaphobacter aggregans]RSL16353.1 putative zinc finger protein [Edaphobacter aggregans]
MADLNQFGSAKPPQSADAQHCAQCEAMLTDALDGTLSTADQAAFDLHMVGCSACATMLAEARRGAAWLNMLKSPSPEPPATLLSRILAQTSGQASAEAKPTIVLGPTDYVRQPNTLLGQPAHTIPASYPIAAYTSGATAKVLPFRQRVAAAFRLQNIRHTLMQPRLAMTAAMAFFSIALTLNLTGVRLSQLRASDFKPSNIKRSFYDTNAKVVRYYDNLVVVYQLESRVRDLQRATESESTTPAPQNSPEASRPSNQQQNQQPDDQKPQNPDQKKAAPRPKSGTSRRENPQGGNTHFVGSTPARGSSPAATEALAFFTNNFFNHIQEGGLV